jgi:catechol 2,3-dioxygenase-like lactoylglutathione lyase family enzyme
MGVAMRDRDGSIDLALRHDPPRAAALAGFDPLALRVPTPAALAGFDPLALRVPTPAALDAWQQRLEDLGEPCGRIVTGHAGRVLVGLRDPDGIEVRLYLPAEAKPEGEQQ